MNRNQPVLKYIIENQPVFGVPLEISFDRNPCHDDIHLPLVLRNCIDYVQTNGKHHTDLHVLK